MTSTKAIPYETLDEVAERMREGKEDMSVVVGEWAEVPTKNYRRPNAGTLVKVSDGMTP